MILGLYLSYYGINQIKTSFQDNYTPNKSSKYKKQTPETITFPNFISPDPVNTGYVQNSQQDPADECRPKGAALYPLQQPYVDYGKWKGGDCCTQDCDVIRFNEPP
jgi:hypothetical protein